MSTAIRPQLTPESPDYLAHAKYAYAGLMQRRAKSPLERAEFLASTFEVIPPEFAIHFMNVVLSESIALADALCQAFPAVAKLTDSYVQIQDLEALLGVTPQDDDLEG